MPDQPETPRPHGPGDDNINDVFSDFPLDADLRDLYLRLRLDGAVWRSQQPEDDGQLAAYAVALAEEAPTREDLSALAPAGPHAAPATHKLRERSWPGRSPRYFGNAGTFIAAALIVALLSVTLLRLSPLATRSGLHGRNSEATPTGSATATASVTTRFTPAPGITVTVSAAPTNSATTPNGAATGTSTILVPPGYPTPVATGSVGSGGGAFPPPTQTTGPPSATSTATPGGPLIDGSSLVSQSPTGLDSTSYSWTQVNFTMLNTGTTTWDSSKGYTLKCVQTCWNQTFLSNTSFLVLPGQTYTFIGNLYPLPAFYYGVYYSTWQMYDPATSYFGQQAVVSVVNHGWSSVLQETSPTCQGDGAQWVSESATGAVSCGASGLVMAQGGTSGVSLALLSTPAAYDYGHYYVQTHVHFTTTSATTFAGVVISTPTGSNTSRPMFMVSPAGYFCFAYFISNCVPGVSALSMPASSDFDISIEVYNSGAAFSGSAGGSPYSEGGGLSGGGGPTGLIEATASGSTDAAYFSNYQLYQYK